MSDMMPPINKEMEGKKLVTVLIPIYKNILSEYEIRSLQQVHSVLQAYPLVIIKPESLDISNLLTKFPRCTAESFDNSYFSNIQGYNRLMLSSSFYERFMDSQYILIHQLDAYVFRDELTEWCKKGYDYIGAPWLKKPVYFYPPISQFMALSLRIDERKGKPSKQHLYNKIGNGGFSLRKVKSHLQATHDYQGRIQYYLAQKRSHFFNEDVFWGTEVPYFVYPDVKEALAFSFDKYPRYCFNLNNHKIPFGCHAWFKSKMKSFWKPIIGF